MELIPGAMSMIELTRIEVAGERTLDLTFSDGARGRRSAAATIARATVLTRPLEDPAYFARAFIEAGALAWPNGWSSRRTACTRDWTRRGCWFARRREQCTSHSPLL